MEPKQSAKVFIGGLNWETTDEKLRRYFENYGTVLEAFVSYDRYTLKPRGFGFVVFEDPAVADKVVRLQHTIDRREVEAKRAVPKDDNPLTKPPAGVPGTRTKKIFVGGLAASVDEAAFRGYFEQFGPVEDAVVMYDHDNRRPRGFGFVTFASEDSVDACLSHGPLQVLRDKQIEIKRAVPKDVMSQQAVPPVSVPTLQSATSSQLLHQVARPVVSHAISHSHNSPSQPIVPAVASLLNQVPSYSAMQSAPPNSLAAALGQSSIGSVGAGNAAGLQGSMAMHGTSSAYNSIGSQQDNMHRGGASYAPMQLRNPQQLASHQLAALTQQQQSRQLHSSQVAAQLGLLTNTMTGVAGPPAAWTQNMAGHSAPAGLPGPLGSTPGPQQGPSICGSGVNTASMNAAAALGLDLQHIGMPAQLTSLPGEGLNPLHVAWEYGRAGLQLPGAQQAQLGSLSHGSGARPGVTGALQAQVLPTSLQTALQTLTAAQAAGPGNTALWDAAAAAVYASASLDASTVQALQANGSSSNSSYLDVPLSFN